MDIKKNVSDTENSVANHRVLMLEGLVGKRFLTIDHLKRELKEQVNLFESESERLKGLDYMLGGEFDNEEPFTLFYIFDNGGLIYITEISF